MQGAMVNPSVSKSAKNPWMWLWESGPLTEISAQAGIQTWSAIWRDEFRVCTWRATGVLHFCGREEAHSRLLGQGLKQTGSILISELSDLELSGGLIRGTAVTLGESMTRWSLVSQLLFPLFLMWNWLRLIACNKCQKCWGQLNRTGIVGSFCQTCASLTIPSSPRYTVIMGRRSSWLDRARQVGYNVIELCVQIHKERGVTGRQPEVASEERHYGAI